MREWANGRKGRSTMYKAPVDEIAFTLKHVAGMADAMKTGVFGELGEDLVDAILSEAGRFATGRVHGLSRARSRRRRAGAISIAAGLKAAGTA